MVSKTSKILLGLLLSSGSVLGKGGKKGEKSSGKGSSNERMACGSHTREIDGGRYAYYRQDDELYVEAHPDFFTNLTGPFESKKDLDPACTKGIFHNMGFLAFNPMGHPSLDFYGGGYGVPHWDMHFFNPSAADTEAGGDVDVSSCAVTGPVPVLCDQISTDPRNIKFNTLPPAEEITGYYEDPNWGGHAIIGHGLHLLDGRGALPGGPLDITLNNNGITSPVGPPPYAICLMQGDGVDRGCRLGQWDGLDPVLLTYNGKVIAQEPMFTSGLISTMAGLITASSPLEVRVQKPFPTAEKQSSKKAMATDVYIAIDRNVDGDKVAQIGLVLDSVKLGKKGKHGKLSMEVTSGPGMQMFAVSGGAALLVAGTALVAFRAMRKANTVHTINIEDSSSFTESTPLTV